MAPVLGYWKLRGLAHPIRYLLEYTGSQYEEKMYKFGPPPGLSKIEWTSEKFKLGLDLPNLPYYIDGNVKLTQSFAIMRYLGRKHDMCGRTEEEQGLVDMLLDFGRDLRMSFAMLCYYHYSPEALKEYLEKLETNLKLLSDILGSKSWFVGDKISVADFVLYEEMSASLALEKTCLDKFPSLKNFHMRFEELPAIKKYMASPNFISYPFNAPFAKILG